MGRGGGCFGWGGLISLFDLKVWVQESTREITDLVVVVVMVAAATIVLVL